jgi:hypothetical protein
MLPPLAIIFALLVGFLAAQVWSDYDRANTAVNREASALRGVILLAAAFPGEPDTRSPRALSGATFKTRLLKSGRRWRGTMRR